MASLIDPSKFAPKSIPKDPDIVDIDEDGEEDFVFAVGKEHPFMQKGCLHLISGKTESGKSTFGLCLMAACISGSFGPIETANGESMRVIWFDTEQKRSKVAKKYRQVMRMARMDNPTKREAKKRLLTVSLRKRKGHKEKIRKIEETVSHGGAAFVFLDGVADLLGDFNNVEESADLVELLMNLAEDYNCAILCMIHLNKGAKIEKGNLLAGIQGNLGSTLLRKVEEGLVVDRTDDLTTIQHGKGRNDFGKIPVLYMTATKGKNQEISLTTEMPILAQISNLDTEQRGKDWLFEAIEEAERTNKKAGDTRLQDLLNLKHNMSKKEAKKLIALGLSLDWVTYDEDKKVYQINKPEEEEDYL